MKKMISSIVCLAMVIGIFGGVPVSVCAAGEPTVTYRLPKTMKIGYMIDDGPGDSVPVAIGENLPVGYGVGLSTDYYTAKLGFCAHAGGGGYEVGPDGVFKAHIFADAVYKPGTFSMQLQVTDKNDKVTKIGSPHQVTVEEPIITNNAPVTIKSGAAFQLTTALTNTVLTNKKVSDFSDAIAHDNDMRYTFNKTDYRYKHTPAYRPIVEVIEGKELVKQSKQDYSNMLNTSESLAFHKAGTVKLKVIYRQINTCGHCLLEGYDESAGKTVFKDQRYNPEKIITINVTDDSKPTPPSSNPTSSNTSKAPTQSNPQSSSPDSSVSGTTSSAAPPASSADEQPVILGDENTGIEIGAQNGVIPEGTTLVVSKSNVVLQDADGKFAAFDISLKSDGVKIQPNGKVLVSIPIPSGYDKERLAIYYVAEDGTKTELPSTVDGDKISFETDHFSTYVVAEKAAAPADTDTTSNAPVDNKTDNNSLWWRWCIIGVVVLAGAGVALWYLKFRKKPTEN